GFARPQSAAQQVAAILGVTPSVDRGQPVQLALAGPAQIAPVAVAQAGSEPVEAVAVADAPPPAAPVEVAAIIRPAITFAPRREIVQALPASYRNGRAAATVRMAAAPRSATVAGRYYVQLGAFDSAGVAHSAWRRMTRNVPRLAEMAPQGMQASVRGASFYRLSVGGMARADAAALCGRVRAKGDRCFVRTHAGEQLASWAGPERLASR
ncbi:sporulation protein, partial [Nostoc sp. 3335mG]